MSKSTWDSLSDGDRRSCIESGRFSADGRSRVSGANDARLAAALIDTVKAALSPPECELCQDTGKDGSRYCECSAGAERAMTDAEDRNDMREGKMSTAKHTSEPWYYDGSWVSTVEGSFEGDPRGPDRPCNLYGGHRIATIDGPQEQPEADANGQRIVSCVNALAGLNPEALPALIAAAEEAEKALLCIDYQDIDEDGLATAVAWPAPAWTKDTIAALRSTLAALRGKP